jgi:hypothetical protein
MQLSETRHSSQIDGDRHPTDLHLGTRKILGLPPLYARPATLTLGGQKGGTTHVARCCRRSQSHGSNLAQIGRGLDLPPKMTAASARATSSSSLSDEVHQASATMAAPSYSHESSSHHLPWCAAAEPSPAVRPLTERAPPPPPTLAAAATWGIGDDKGF